MSAVTACVAVLLLPSSAWAEETDGPSDPPAPSETEGAEPEPTTETTEPDAEPMALTAGECGDELTPCVVVVQTDADQTEWLTVIGAGVGLLVFAQLVQMIGGWRRE